MKTNLCSHTYTHMFLHICARVHSHTHTRIYTHAYTQVATRPFSTRLVPHVEKLSREAWRIVATNNPHERACRTMNRVAGLHRMTCLADRFLHIISAHGPMTLESFHGKWPAETRHRTVLGGFAILSDVASIPLKSWEEGGRHPLALLYAYVVVCLSSQVYCEDREYCCFVGYQLFGQTSNKSIFEFCSWVPEREVDATLNLT